MNLRIQNILVKSNKNSRTIFFIGTHFYRLHMQYSNYGLHLDNSSYTFKKQNPSSCQDFIQI